MVAEGGNMGGRTEIELHPAFPGRERMIRVRHSIIRDERLQITNFLNIALGQSTIPDTAKCVLSCLEDERRFRAITRTIRRRYR